jgi:hypothetical protein
MQKTKIKILIVLLSFFQATIFTSCQAPKPNPTPGLAWQIAVSKVEIKPDLSATESVTQYDGSTIDMVHSQTPEIGNVYLILDVSISKADNQSTATFEWQSLVVNDSSGNTYQRLENDTFLEQYQYIPRLTGLPLRFGENSGWVCYQIPAAVATGKLTLEYSAEGSLQEIVLQK